MWCLSMTCNKSVVISGYSINKTDRHDITEILLSGTKHHNPNPVLISLGLKWCKSIKIMVNRSWKLGYFRFISSDMDMFMMSLRTNHGLLLINRQVKTFLKQNKIWNRFHEVFIHINNIKTHQQFCTTLYASNIFEQMQERWVYQYLLSL